MDKNAGTYIMNYEFLSINLWEREYANTCLSSITDAQVVWNEIKIVIKNETCQKLWGCGNICEVDVIVPKLIDSHLFEILLPIKFIDCNDNHSFAVDIEGGVSYWGRIGCDIQWTPTKLNVNNVMKINSLDECIILKETGKLFVYSFSENIIIEEIIVGFKVEDISRNLYETEECVYRRESDEFEIKIIKKTNFINFYDYYSSEENITYKTIHIKTEENNGQVVKYLTTKEIQLNPEYNRQTNEELLVFKEKNVFDTKFHNSFQLIGDRIGEGSFGEVFRVKERKTQDLFAIKRIEMRGDINYLTLYQLIISTILQINGNTIWVKLRLCLNSTVILWFNTTTLGLNWI